MRLDEHDRRMRFCMAVTPAAIRRYSNSIDWSRDALYGHVEDGVIRGLAQFSPDDRLAPKSAEAAFSVEPAWRRRGVAANLMELILAVALIRRVPKLEMIMLCENFAMREIARRNGFLFMLDESEIYATARLGSAEPTVFAHRIFKASEAPMPGPHWNFANPAPASNDDGFDFPPRYFRTALPSEFV